VGRVDTHPQRTVAVDNPGVDAGERAARELEAIVERDRRRTRMRSRAAGCRKTDKNDD
jgi:hypothetical protein